MKKNILIWTTALILVAAAVFLMNKSGVGSTGLNRPSSGTGAPESGASAPLADAAPLIDAKSRQKAPDFTLTDLTGKSVTLSDLKGKSVYLNFWATWCPWCVEELPDLDKISQEYRDKNLIVLTLDGGEDQATVSKFAADNNYHFNVLLDTDLSVAQKYGVSSIPVSVLIDADGNIAQKRLGAMTEAQMKAMVDSLLREKQG